MSFQGHVASIHISKRKADSLESLDRVRAIPGSGLEGDRYSTGTGSFSDPQKPDREITLIEMEAIEALPVEYGVEITPGEARRNIVTRGVPLNHLVGRTFQIGEITIEGIRLCEPCGHLARLTDPKVEKGLVHRGGLRARIVTEGFIRVGDQITPA
jgi:MOSC domain-containing protein YiiM